MNPNGRFDKSLAW